MSRVGWLALALLALFGLRVVLNSSSISATYDESHHLIAGYSYLRFGDFRLNPEHPPLSKKIAALPLLFLDPLPRDLDPDDPRVHPGRGSRSWQRFKQLWRGAVRDFREGWFIGHEVVYGVDDDTLERHAVAATMEIDPVERIEPDRYLNNPDRLFFWGRLPLLVFGLLTGWLVFLWARDLWGPVAAALPLALATFDPNLLAHSGLVTSDVAATSLILGTVYALWRYATKGRRFDALSTVVFFSLALTVKFSALLLIPVCSVLVAVSAWRWQARGQTLAAVRLLSLLVLCLASSFVTLWAAYGFRYSAVAPPQAEAMPVDEVLAEVVRQEARWDPEVAGRRHLGAFDRIVAWANQQRLIPEAYAQGLAVYRLHGRVRPSYLNGEHSLRGFRTYFLWTFLFKTPLVTLLVLVVGLVLASRGCRGEDLLYLLLPALLYFLVAAASYSHIGNRHILPVYPFLFVLTGGVLPQLAGWLRKSQASLAVPLILLIGLSSVLVFAPPWRPVWIADRPLEFFNELAGGPRNGYRHLVDSNLDWGQGLDDLRAWLDDRDIDQPINLCYFGTADPRWYQIPFVKVPCDYPFAPPFSSDEEYRPTIVPGYLVISATHLVGERDSPGLRQVRARALERAELVDRIGYSLFVYRLER